MSRREQMRLGVISDTHGLFFDEAIPSIFKGVNTIIRYWKN